MKKKVGCSSESKNAKGTINSEPEKKSIDQNQSAPGTIQEANKTKKTAYVKPNNQRRVLENLS